jgi:hypothetical protein
MSNNSGKLDPNWTTPELEKAKAFSKWFYRVWWPVLIIGTAVIGYGLHTNHLL